MSTILRMAMKPMNIMVRPTPIRIMPVGIPPMLTMRRTSAHEARRDQEQEAGEADWQEGHDVPGDPLLRSERLDLALIRTRSRIV